MCGKTVKHKISYEIKPIRKRILKFVPYFPSGNVILVPVNHRICKSCINLKKTLIQTTHRKTIVQLTTEKILSQKIDFKKLDHKIKKIFQNYSEKTPT